MQYDAARLAVEGVQAEKKPAQSTAGKPDSLKYVEHSILSQRQSH